jgi:sugar phosphate permease
VFKAIAANERIHYAWIVAGVTVLAVVVASAERSAPGVLIPSLKEDLGWSRAVISLAVSIGLVLYGLISPVAGALIDRFGPKRLMIGGLLLIAASTGVGAVMNAEWQLILAWGFLSGVGTGMVSAVLGATVANRWFVERRGLVLGIFGGAISIGQLIFVPFLMWMITSAGWRYAVVALAAVALLALIPVLALMRDDPSDIGLRPYGAAPNAPIGAAKPMPIAGIMRRATRTPEFWLLAGSFFVCGATSNGLVGVHFVSHALDHGIGEGTAAGTLALMGAMTFVGTICSGWLTDRYDPRKLLAVYYTFRGLSLFLLPSMTSFQGLAVFAVLFGLDYIATVPPTSTLTADIFGRHNVGAVFGWVFAAHQIGAASAAFLAGVARDAFGDYGPAFIAGGAISIVGGLMALRVSPEPIALQPSAISRQPSAVG